MVSCNKTGALKFISLIRYNMLCLAGRELSRWARGDEKHDKARICGALEKVSACYFAYSVSSLCIFIDDFCISEIVTDRRRSSGFSRGASIYRGVTRFVCAEFAATFCFFINKSTYIEKPHRYVHVDYITGITSMEDGSLGLAGLLETRICTSALSVRKISIWLLICRA